MAIDTQNLWDNYNGKGFAAEYSKYSVRASKDEAGQDIHSTLTNLDSRTSVIPSGEASATSSLTVTNSGSTWATWGEGDFEIPEALYVTLGNRMYPAVKIGNQLWTTENIDYQWTALHIATADNDYGGDVPYGSYYNNSPETYGVDGNRYGMLYNYSAAQYIDSILTGGWHVPSDADFATLFATVNNSVATLKQTDGFHAVMAGQRCMDAGAGRMKYDYVDSDSYYRVVNNGQRYAYITNSSVNSSYSTEGRTQCSIRLVKNLS